MYTGGLYEFPLQDCKEGIIKKSFRTGDFKDFDTREFLNPVLRKS